MVGPTEICRSLAQQITQCGSSVGRVSTAHTTESSGQKITASFTDTLPANLESDSPSAVATYAVEVLNRNERGAALSNPAQISLVRTLAPPADFQARVTAQGVVLSWTNETPAVSGTSVHYVVRVIRNLLGSQENTVVGEKPIGGEPTLTDPNIEWQKTYEYRAETVTQVEQANKAAIEVEGDDAPTLKVFADDTFPPAVPTGLQAASSGPGQQLFVDLIWAPDTDLDLAGYDVYRSEPGTAPIKLNTELIKTPAYRDTSVAAGRTYIYSVTAVDLRKNESARSEEATETLPQ